MGTRRSRRAKARRPSACPQCGSPTVVPVIYGLPGPELWEEAEREKVILGGCIIQSYNTRFGCKACGHEFEMAGE
jgi:transcription elongation factor Elf1